MATEANTVPEPVNRAGITDADPDQSDVSQDPSVVVVGDLDEIPGGDV